MIYVTKAIKNLAPGAEFTSSNNTNSITKWLSPDIKQPTQAQIDAELKKLQDEHAAQAYARNRKADYPDWGTQLNKIYDDGITKWKSEMIDPVKAKWPKDNSGPK